MIAASTRIYLSVPFDDNDQGKKFGGKRPATPS
jgi:hypothetical protein